MRLVQISDCHLLAYKNHAVYAVNPYESLEQVLSLIAQDPPDALIATGDISGDDSAESYGHFIELMARYLPACEWRVIPGNHDNNAQFLPSFSGHILKAGASWALGEWRVHGLDTRYEDARGTVQTNELRALGEDIVNHSEARHLLALHHNPVPTGSWMDRHCLENAAALEDWLSVYPQIAGIIHGHIHAEVENTFAGVRVLSVPSTCWQWDLQPEFAVCDKAPGFREMYLPPQGEWTSTIRRVAK